MICENSFNENLIGINTYSMIGVVAFTLAKCREVLGQIEFGIGLLKYRALVIWS